MLLIFFNELFTINQFDAPHYVITATKSTIQHGDKLLMVKWISGESHSRWVECAAMPLSHGQSLPPVRAINDVVLSHTSEPQNHYENRNTE